MSELSEFLLARIAEDEAAAREVAPLYFARLRVSFNRLEDHFARWDPARVLAECEAKRRIVDGLQIVEQYRGAAEVPLWILLTLAQPYADHADYRPEWRP